MTTTVQRIQHSTGANDMVWARNWHPLKKAEKQRVATTTTTTTAHLDKLLARRGGQQRYLRVHLHAAHHAGRMRVAGARVVLIGGLADVLDRDPPFHVSGHDLMATAPLFDHKRRTKRNSKVGALI